jgi:biopolymer transport protein ExbB
MIDSFLALMHRGGPVMWPLFILSVVSVAVSFERGVFWFKQNGPGAKRGFVMLMESFRRGDRARVDALAGTSDTVYSRVATALLNDGASDAVAVGSVEAERIRMDRCMATLSTIITAAPMLGILGTVTGIIRSFELLGGGGAMVDPRAISGGIGEALVATASGLVVALLSLFPFMGSQQSITMAESEGGTASFMRQSGMTDSGVLQVNTVQGVPVRRHNLLVATVKADGSTESASVGALMDMRAWIDAADRADFSHADN